MNNDGSASYGAQNQYTGADSMQPRSPFPRGGRDGGVYITSEQGERILMTPADMALVKQCARECFVGRIVPLTIASCGAVFYLGKIGRINPSAMYYAGAFCGSFLVGKVSYGNRCNQLIINSNVHTPFAEAVRMKHKDANKLGMSPNMFGSQGSSDSWKSSSDQSDDRWSKPISSSRFGNNQPKNVNKWGDVGFDKDDIGYAKEDVNWQPDTNVNDPFKDKDFGTGDLPAKTTQQTFTNYDELRQRNRASFK